MLENEYLQLHLEDSFPNLNLNTTSGEFKLYDYMENSWLVLFSHPKDFTPVCTTELLRASKIINEFTSRNTKILAMSCDSIDSHKKWVDEINSTYKTKIQFPIIADKDLSIAKQIGMVHPKHGTTETIRTTYIICPNKKIKIIMQYPPYSGRNFNEILRVIDSLQITQVYDVLTPENWILDDKVFINHNISNEDAIEKFPQGWKEINSYMKLVDLNK